MAPSAITDDYYEVLGVSQDATLELIARSYRRLALKHHPDRGGSTQAFQALSLAYETLRDVNTRRQYDRIYPSIVRSRKSKPRTRTQTPRPPPASAPPPPASAPPPPASAPQPTAGSDESDAARIAVLRKENEKLRRQTRAEREELKLSILQSQRNIRVLKQEIKALSTGIAATKAAPGTWHSDSHHGQDYRKARERLNTKLDTKKHLLGLCERLLQLTKKLLKLSGDDFETFMNEREIRDIEAIMLKRKAQEQHETKRIVMERLGKVFQQSREQWVKDTLEALSYPHAGRGTA